MEISGNGKEIVQFVLATGFFCLVINCVLVAILRYTKYNFIVRLGSKPSKEALTTNKLELPHHYFNNDNDENWGIRYSNVGKISKIPISEISNWWWVMPFFLHMFYRWGYYTSFDYFSELELSKKEYPTQQSVMDLFPHEIMQMIRNDFNEKVALEEKRVLDSENGRKRKENFRASINNASDKELYLVNVKHEPAKHLY